MGWLEDLAKKAANDPNVSAVVNVAKGRGKHSSVSSHQKIVQRNGRTVENTRVVRISNPTKESHDREA